MDVPEDSIVYIFDKENLWKTNSIEAKMFFWFYFIKFSEE